MGGGGVSLERLCVCVVVVVVLLLLFLSLNGRCCVHVFSRHNYVTILVWY